MSAKRDRIRLRQAALQLVESNESLCRTIERLVGALQGTEPLNAGDDLNEIRARAQQSRREGLPGVRAWLKELD